MSKIPCHVPNVNTPDIVFERRSTRISFVSRNMPINTIDDLHIALQNTNVITLDTTYRRRERFTRYVPEASTFVDTK